MANPNGKRAIGLFGELERIIAERDAKSLQEFLRAKVSNQNDEELADTIVDMLMLYALRYGARDWLRHQSRYVNSAYTRALVAHRN